MKQHLRIADQNFAHGTSLGSGDLKIYPTFIQWHRGDNRIGDIIVITDNHLKMVDRYDEPIKIAWLLEPPAYAKSNYEWIAKNYTKFKYILTYDDALLRVVPNAYPYYYGGCWIEHNDRRLGYLKSKDISIIVSDKKMTEGHKLRHQVVEEFGGYVDVFGRGYKPINNKIAALRDYKYSIVIENERKENWFTEKIIDVFKTGTIPIYWGAPNITDHFDSNGIIRFDSIDELNKIIERIDDKSIGDTDKQAIEDNFHAASKYCCTEDWLYRYFFKPKGLLQ